MPTGYTIDVANGKIISLSDFAIRCARAFGACVTMRDDPLDTKIPEEFKASDYHLGKISEAQEELARLEKLDSSQLLDEALNERDQRIAELTKSLNSTRDEH